MVCQALLAHRVSRHPMDRGLQHFYILISTVCDYCTLISLITYFRGCKKTELVGYSSHRTPNNVAAPLCKFHLVKYSVVVMRVSVYN